jgi:hypothetical protein
MKLLSYYKLIQKNAPLMGGVFSINDLRNLFNQTSDVLLHREIQNLEKERILRRFRQGFYVAEQFNPELLACRIYPDSYISCGTVLAKNLIIGSIPSKTIYAVKAGRNKEFTGFGLRIHYFGIKSELIFDITIENGIRYASAEKAFVDTLYFYQKGERISFDPFSDVNIAMLNKENIAAILEHYRNQHFVSFVKGIIRND